MIFSSHQRGHNGKITRKKRIGMGREGIQGFTRMAELYQCSKGSRMGIGRLIGKDFVLGAHNL